MKVYVVTSGYYSDYHIEKIFTDKKKAEEFAEWVENDAEVEEYEIADDKEYYKYYKFYIDVEYNCNTKKISDPTCNYYRSVDTVFNQNYNCLEDEREYGKDIISLQLKRCISAENIDIEFYKNKFKKVAIDMMYIVLKHMEDGISMKHIKKLIEHNGE